DGRSVLAARGHAELALGDGGCRWQEAPATSIVEVDGKDRRAAVPRKDVPRVKLVEIVLVGDVRQIELEADRVAPAISDHRIERPIIRHRFVAPEAFVEVAGTRAEAELVVRSPVDPEAEIVPRDVVHVGLRAG